MYSYIYICQPSSIWEYTQKTWPELIGKTNALEAGRFGMHWNIGSSSFYALFESSRQTMSNLEKGLYAHIVLCKMPVLDHKGNSHFTFWSSKYSKHQTHLAHLVFKNTAFPFVWWVFDRIRNFGNVLHFYMFFFPQLHDLGWAPKSIWMPRRAAWKAKNDIPPAGKASMLQSNINSGVMKLVKMTNDQTLTTVVGSSFKAAKHDT